MTKSIASRSITPKNSGAKRLAELHWFKKWDKVLDWNVPNAKWFVGGKTNLSYNCLDRQIECGHGDKVAILWEGEPAQADGGLKSERSPISELRDDVCQFANGLKKLGVKSGDRVTIYMPMVPEAAIAMLACARLGAAHSVIFGGFSSQAIADRVEDAKSNIIITADGGLRRGAVVPLKNNVDERAAPKTESASKKVVVLQARRSSSNVADDMVQGRDVWWHDVVADQSTDCPAEHDGHRRPALRPLHLRLDRQAQRHPAHHRRVHGRHVSDDQVCLRSPRKRHLLVYRRRRLGDRPQLHRLRPADQRRDRADVRRRAELPRFLALLGDDRAAQGDRLLHRADRDPRVHARRARVRRQARSVEPATARHGRRADQSRSVDVVSRGRSATRNARSSTRGGRPKPA